MSIKNVIISAILGLGLATVAYANTDDTAISAAVKSKISANQSLSGQTINVNSNNGNVNLSGNVESDTQLNTAVEIAQSVNGVTDVDTDNLTVKGSKHPMNDALITAKIKGLYIQQKLFGDKDVAAFSISVETNNGVVSLSGTADTQEQLNNAIRLAKTIKGVKSVNSVVKLSTATS